MPKYDCGSGFHTSFSDFPPLPMIGGPFSVVSNPVAHITISTLRSLPSIVSIPSGVKRLILVEIKLTLSSTRASR